MKSHVAPAINATKGSWRTFDDYENLAVYVVLPLREPAAAVENLPPHSSPGSGTVEGAFLHDMPLKELVPQAFTTSVLAEDPPLEKPPEQEHPHPSQFFVRPLTEPISVETPAAQLSESPRAVDITIHPSGESMAAEATQEHTPPSSTVLPPVVQSSGIRVPPPINAPAATYERGERFWRAREVPRNIKLDCYSHRGPRWTWFDKENEDFAFAVVCPDRDGEPWALAGVCDGVSNSTWAERGAQIAASVFIEVVSERLGSGFRLDEEIQRALDKRTLAVVFHQRMKAALIAESKCLFEGGYLHPSWKQDLYERTFLRGHRAAENRMDWLQTTLLATALGPRGGFALLLGDGFVRVDRHKYRQGVHRKVIPLHSDDRAPERRVSLMITADEVEQGLRGVPLEQSDRIAVLLATDGVSKSPRHGLEDFSLEGSEVCQRFLDDLAGRAKGDVESDNLSIAFASRETL